MSAESLKTTDERANYPAFGTRNTRKKKQKKKTDSEEEQSAGLLFAVRECWQIVQFNEYTATECPIKSSFEGTRPPECRRADCA